jgi:hypothetical protein
MTEFESFSTKEQYIPVAHCEQDAGEQFPGEVESFGSEEAYTDRNLAVQLLALVLQDNGYKVGWLADDPNPQEGWSILMMELPEGQISYHIPIEDQIVELPDFYEWDGHSVEEKRARIVEFCKKYQNPETL